MKGCGILSRIGSVFRSSSFPDNLPKSVWRQVVNHVPMKTVAAIQAVNKGLAQEFEQEIKPTIRKALNQFKESLANGKQIRDLVKEPTPIEKESFELLLENDLSTNRRAELLAIIQSMMTDEQRSQLNEMFRQDIGKIGEMGHSNELFYEFRCALVLGADPNQTAEDGKTALHEASRRGYTEIMKTLLDAGANINQTDKHGRTALHKASSRGYIAVVKTLIENGADLNIRDSSGGPLLSYRNTALGEAVMNNKTDCINALLSAGARIDLRNGDGHTVLHLATHLANTSTVNTLLDAGIDLNLRDGDGRTALEWVTERSQTIGGYEPVIELLKQASEQHTPAEESEA